MNNDSFIVTNATIMLEDGILENGELVVENGAIASITRSGEFQRLTTPNMGIVDAHGEWVIPGFIDVHVHGGHGADFMDASPQAYNEITRFHASHGTTGMLATTMTAPKADIDRVLEATKCFMSSPMPYAALLGVHLEGPFISPKWPGAQNPAYIVPPNLDWLQEWISRYPGLIKQLTLAPETEGAFDFIKTLRDNGIVAACGHTDALYDVLEQAVDYGLQHAVHTFNAMRGLHHREPGTVGAVLSDPRISAELIADGHHVHPAAIRLLTACKTGQSLLLITDAISAAGLSDKQYSLGGLDVTVRDGVARLTEGGNLAGSTLTMDAAFRFMLKHTSLTPEEISRLASGNPAQLLGIDDRTGSIKAGKQADLILMSSDFHVRRTWVKGKDVSLA